MSNAWLLMGMTSATNPSSGVATTLISVFSLSHLAGPPCSWSRLAGGQRARSLTPILISTASVANCLGPHEERCQDQDVRTGGKPFRIWLEDGRDVDVVTIGGLAKALGRSSSTIRRWEREHLLPRAPLHLLKHDPRAERRLYPVELVEAIAMICDAQPIGRRRSPNRFHRQQLAIVDAWSKAHRSLQAPNQHVDRTGVL
jgi:DNA-binding transcriptional regulator YiaG